MEKIRGVLLAGDVGGTHTRLGLFRPEAGSLTRLGERDFASREYAGLEDLAADFVAAHRQATIACAAFGVAGPVRNGRSEATNLPWVVDANILADRLEIPEVALLNDLEANAYGIAALGEADFVVVSPGNGHGIGNSGVISPGTGLGEAGLYWDGEQHRPFPSEGGHGDFAPRNDLEIELLRHLLNQFAHVSYERVLSGPGLVNLYRFFRDTGRAAEPPWLLEEMERNSPPVAISQAALEGKSELCRMALDMFISILGAEAGNLALKMMATGGIYIGGGIAPKIAQRLTGRNFVDAFLDKGRMRPVLEAVPVHVVMNDRTALLGAALYASRRASLNRGSLYGE
jgi:glucokinase